jgi:CelD/BcsL family acetyltransferase involved in cellulose biosynthesis
MRWRDRGGGVLKEDRVQQFHALAVPELDRAGMLDLLLCKIGGEIVGIYYGLRDRSRAFAYLLGFDPAWASISPGALLIGHAIEQAARNGAREFHFLRGNEPYKYAWGATDRVSSRIVVPREVATWLLMVTR